jgi:hypothetical protein
MIHDLNACAFIAGRDARAPSNIAIFDKSFFLTFIALRNKLPKYLKEFLYANN